MYDKDSLQTFTFENASIRGQIAHLDETFLTIINQRPYPPVIRQLLGEAIVSCLLAMGSIKFEGELSLQFQGDKNIPLLIVQCNHLLEIRAFAQFTPGLSHEMYGQAFLNGQMTMTINHFDHAQSYQSILKIISTSMAENLMHYFAQSEQISTRIWLAVGEQSVAGMLLQLMPDKDTAAQEQFWEYALKLGETVTPQELLTLDNNTLLFRLYHETTVTLFPSRQVIFKCRCDPDKMKQVLTILGEKDLNQLVLEQGNVSISCDFCNQHYQFDAIDLAMLFRTY